MPVRGSTSTAFSGLLFAAALVTLDPGAPAMAQTTTPDTTPAPEQTGTAPADTRVWHHALSLIGTPRYPQGFARFDYVNPDAPAGGLLRLSDTGSFDSLNFVPARGETPLGIGLIYDTLMTPSLDEVSTEYGLLAEAVSFPDDYSSVTYRLREGARWHDGMPVTAEDVVFSYEAITANNPQQAFYYQHVEKAEVTGPRDVTFTFDQAGNRELPQIVGQLIVMPKHWWTGMDASGNPRDIARGTLEIPLGSGRYRIAEVLPGRSITYERTDDYWAADLNVAIGTGNFGAIRYEFFRDDTIEFEAFKADQTDWRIETTARNWATGYDTPAVSDGRIVRELFEEPYRDSGLMVGLIFNLRRPLFQDVHVRRAMSYVFDYEETNRTLFFGQYARLSSYFHGTELAASGLPEGRERDILEAVDAAHPGLLPEGTLTQAFVNPVNDTPEAHRENLRQALALFAQAGWHVREEVNAAEADTGFVHRVLVAIGLASDPTRQVMRDASGEPVTFEWLLNGPGYERVALAYKEMLAQVGIEMTIRVVDSSQFVNRLRARDYDVIFSGWAQSLSPGNEQRDFFSSEAAERDGSRNYPGIRNAAIDALIERVIFATNREDLVAATHALDRALLAGQYLVPGWTLRQARTARWDRFSHPDPLPYYSLGFPDLWWFDAAKAAATGGANARIDAGDPR